MRTLTVANTDSHVALFGHMKVLHTPTAVGSAALAAAVPNYPGKATRFPAKVNDVLNRFIVSQYFQNGIDRQCDNTDTFP